MHGLRALIPGLQGTDGEITAGGLITEQTFSQALASAKASGQSLKEQLTRSLLKQ